MIVKRLLTLGIIMFFSASLSGCGSETDKKVQLSFGDVYADFDIHLPPNTVGRMAREGGLLSAGAVFDPPVHPIGEIRSLSIRGYDIELESTTLNEGLLMTVEFGAIEFLIPQEGKIEMWGAQSQKDAIEKWLSRQ